MLGRLRNGTSVEPAAPFTESLSGGTSVGIPPPSVPYSPPWRPGISGAIGAPTPAGAR